MVVLNSLVNVVSFFESFGHSSSLGHSLRARQVDERDSADLLTTDAALEIRQCLGQHDREDSMRSAKQIEAGVKIRLNSQAICNSLI